jgi:hypothetical protein
VPLVLVFDPECLRKKPKDFLDRGFMMIAMHSYRQTARRSTPNLPTNQDDS